MVNITDILIGIAIGDAFGAGVEFQDRNWIRNNVDFTKFVNVRHLINVQSEKLGLFTANYKILDYTDDTEMTIGVINAIISEKEFSEALLVEKWEEEYRKGESEKGYGRNGHGSMAWYFNGEMTINEVRDFQRFRKNPGNAPATRAIPLGLMPNSSINNYAKINAMATHPNENAIISSQCIARACEYLVVKNGDRSHIVDYVKNVVNLNLEYERYFDQIDRLESYENLAAKDFSILCGNQPIEEPYFLAGINGMPSDSKFTTGCVIYILKHSKSSMDALKMSIYLGGDVDSVAALTTGISAGVYGLKSIPSFMIENLEGVDYLGEIAFQFSLCLESECL